MKTLDAQKILQNYDRQGVTVWTIASLRMVLPDPKTTFRKTIESLVRNEILTRVARGVYLFINTSRDRHVVLGELIATLRHGEYCFESLESAASKWSIIPQTTLGCITVLTTGRSGYFETPYGAIEFVHTQAAIGEIVANTIQRDDFIPIANADYTIHGLMRCGRTTELDEALSTGWQEE